MFMLSKIVTVTEFRARLGIIWLRKEHIKTDVKFKALGSAYEI